MCQPLFAKLADAYSNVYRCSHLALSSLKPQSRRFWRLAAAI